MTRVVYVLLALNLGWLVWNLHMRRANVTVPTAAVLAPAAGVADQLPLLTELNADALRLRVTATRATSGPPTAAPTAADSASAARDAAALASESATIAIRADVATSAAGAASTASVADGNGNGNGAAATAPLVAAATTVTQGTEFSGATGRSSASRACLTLGPLSADAPLADMRSWLGQAGATVDVRTDERREVALHWVYFPPRTNRAQALAEVERMRNEGVTDVIAVPKGDMANAISLGVFSRTDSRDRRVKEMNGRGYQPSVAPRYRVKLATWVDVSAPLGTLSDENIQARWPEVELRHQPCGNEPVAVAPSLTEPIAVGQASSYNAPSAEPRRFYFSGSDASRPSATTGASQ